MGDYLTNEEVKKLITRIKSGDNEVWESLYYNFERYVHDRAWNRLRKLNVPENRKEDRRIWHYRVDLMSDVEILTDDDGKNIPIDVSAFKGLPICNAY